MREESNAQRGWVTCPRWHSSERRSQDSEPGFFALGLMHQPSQLGRVAEFLKRHSRALTLPSTALVRQEARGGGPGQGHTAICTPSTA